MADLGAGLDGKRQQQPLGGDELVAGLFGNLLGLVEDASEGRVHVELLGTRAGNLGKLAKCGMDRRLRGLGAAAGPLDEACCEALRVVDENLQEMLGGELLMALA